MDNLDLHNDTYISYTYERPQGLDLQVAHGVWGGINPHGEIEMDFYNESDLPPKSTIQMLRPDGSLGEEKLGDTSQGQQIVRHIHSRILLTYDSARAILEWLEDRVAELENNGGNTPFPINTGIEQ